MAQLCGPLVPKISVCRNFLLRILDQRKKTGWFDILTSKTNFFFESLVLCSWFKPNSDWNKQWEIIYINQGILWLFEKSKSADLAWRKARRSSLTCSRLLILSSFSSEFTWLLLKGAYAQSSLRTGRGKMFSKVTPFRFSNLWQWLAWPLCSTEPFLHKKQRGETVKLKYLLTYYHHNNTIKK